MESRSSPSATRARALLVDEPTSIVTSGWATRLRNHCGSRGWPPAEAKMAMLPPTCWYMSGLTRSVPVLAPLWWSSTIGAPSKNPPTFPPFSLNSVMTFVLKSSPSATARPFVVFVFELSSVDPTADLAGHGGQGPAEEAVEGHRTADRTRRVDRRVGGE